MHKLISSIVIFAAILSACAPSPGTVARQTSEASTAAAAAWTPTPAAPPTPVQSPTPAYPTYDEITKTYPTGVELNCTDAEVAEITADGKWVFTSGLVCPGQSQLTVEKGGKFTVGELFFGKPWKSYGTRVSLKNNVTIDGVAYPAGARLTVDKDLNWVQIASSDAPAEGVAASVAPTAMQPPTEMPTPTSVPTPLPTEVTVMVSPKTLKFVESWNSKIQAFTPANHPITTLAGLTPESVGFWNNSRLGFNLYKEVVKLLNTLDTPWDGGLYASPDANKAFASGGLRLYFTDDSISEIDGAAKVVFKSADSGNASAAASPDKISFGQVYYSDAFKDNSNQWSVGNVDGPWWVGTRLIKNGVLDWNGTSRREMFSSVYPDNPALQEKKSDVQVSARVKLINTGMNGAFGLIVRGGAEKNFYAYLVDNSGSVGFFLHNNDAWTTLVDWSKNPSWNKSGWNKMMVQAAGSHFRLYFNDKLLAETDDATLKTGQSGVMIEIFQAGEKIQLQFDDFEVHIPSP